MARKRTRKQLQADENKRKAGRLLRLVLDLAKNSNGLEAMLDAGQQPVESEAKALKAQPLSVAQVSVIDDRGTVMTLAEVPDELIRLEYHKRVRVGRKTASPSYYCEHCDTIMQRAEYRAHSRIECAAKQNTGDANLPSLQDTVTFKRHIPDHVPWVGKGWDVPRSLSTSGYLARSQRKSLAL
jgi:hypothetical protein